MSSFDLFHNSSLYFPLLGSYLEQKAKEESWGPSGVEQKAREGECREGMQARLEEGSRKGGTHTSGRRDLH